MDTNTAPPPLPVGGSDDIIWIILCHLSLLIGVGFLLPLIVYFVKKQDSPNTAEHAREALNFHISVYICGFVGFLLCFVLIGVPFLIALSVGSIICSIIACVQASDGRFYRYPLTLRFV